MSEAQGLFGKPPFLVCLYGSKHSGKSVVIRHTCHAYRRQFSHIVAVSSTAFNQAFDFLPEKHVHSEYQPQLLTDLMDRQMAHKKASREVHALVIFDDILGALDLRKPGRYPELQRLWSSNRHYNISVLIATQVPKGIPPIVRQNCDFCTMHKSLQSALGTLFEDYGDRPKSEFVKFLLANTCDYNFVLYSAREHSAEKKLQVCKIPPAFLDHRFRLLY